MNGYSRFLPWLVLGVGVLTFVALALPPGVPDGEMEIYEFGKLPVVADGRIKPLDTVARVELMLISHRQDYVDNAGNNRPAIAWLLDLLSSKIRGYKTDVQERVFAVNDAEMRDFLALPARRDALYSSKELKQNGKLDNLANQAKSTPPVERTTLERTSLSLGLQTEMYKMLGQTAWNMQVFRIENDQIVELLGLQRRTGLRYALAEIAPRYLDFMNEVVRVEKKDAKERDVYEQKVAELEGGIRRFMALADIGSLRVVPPAKEGGEWTLLGDDARPECVRKWLGLLSAYGTNDAPGFNNQLRDYESWLGRQATEGSERCGFEAAYNNFEPFILCSYFYVIVAVFGFLSMLGWKEPLRLSALYLTGLALSVHTLALLGRMFIQHRPAPVTNLYSSAVFIGWGCVLTGFVLEWIFANGLGNLAAGLLGALTTLLAHHLLAEGDTVEMMRAVLDTNFWLATHVTCVTLGYTATLVAAMLGMMYILGGVFTPALDQGVRKTLGQMTYGIICFAMFFSFVGTVLGGIWADQSWGRFWGWDPKENGALLIVLVNAVILHARWGGLVKQRGIAVLAVLGAMVTAWSWFGTNQLGVGLHAYGFSNRLVRVCDGTWLVCGLVALLGACVPLRHWRSYAVVPVGGPPSRSGDLERPRPKPRPELNRVS